MLKFSLAIILCICFAGNMLADAAAVNSTNLVREKRDYLLGYPYNYNYYYPYNNYYYYWYNYYPTQFTLANVAACNACPTQCPGQCGLYSSLYACRVNGCAAIIGEPCCAANIERGLYLHVYPYDANKYIQCDTTPGLVYIRNCPAGTVFDPVYKVCNYAAVVLGK